MNKINRFQTLPKLKPHVKYPPFEVGHAQKNEVTEIICLYTPEINIKSMEIRCDKTLYEKSESYDAKRPHIMILMCGLFSRMSVILLE